MKYLLLFALSGLALACADDPSSAGSAGAGGSSSSGGSGQSGGAAGTAQAGAAGLSGSSGQAGAPACDGHLAEGVAVKTGDVYRYAPYAVDGCQLLYLAPTPDGAELRLRDLVDGTEQTLAPASESPQRPSIAGPVAAWEATADGRQVVRVRSGGETRTVTGSFAQATEPRATVDAVVLTTWTSLDPGADTDIALLSVASGALTPVFTGPGQQRFADVSPTHVAFTDFAEDPDGVFNDNDSDIADVAVLDRGTGLLTLHKLPGKQAFAQLAGNGEVVYLNWPGEHPEPKLQAYGVSVWTLATSLDRSLGEVHTSVTDYGRPEARGGLAQWTIYPGGYSRLLRAVLADGLPGHEVGGLEGKTIYSPVSAGSFSLIATRPTGDVDSPPTLQVVPQ